MGMNERFTAVVRCSGGCFIQEGKRACSDGCIGCGLCVRSCESGAIELITDEKSFAPDGTEVETKPILRRHARVNREKCTGCGKCAGACPKKIIDLSPDLNTIQPVCSSKKPGKEARMECTNSCIACGICERSCPAGAISVIDFRAVINQTQCIACGMCASKCPRGVIHDADGIISIKL